MKKYKLICLMVILVLSLQAKPQSLQSALTIAGNFLEARQQDGQIIENYTIADQSGNLVYIFNLEPAGFVAISADNNVYPVIAYSYKKALKEADHADNVFFTLLKWDVRERLAYYKDKPNEAHKNNLIWSDYIAGNFISRNFQQWPAAGTTITDGWIETTWNQSGVFNQMCPIDNSGERSVVGCVATAMAMIIDFHAHVGDVSFDDSDDYASGWWNPIYIDDDYLERDFPSFPELNVYLDELKDHYQNDIYLTSQDKAALSFSCGVSVEMGYSSQGSGAWTSDVAIALLNKFDYDSATWIDNYGSSFYAQLSQNMIEMRPAEMSIATSSGEGGHAIIVDGYNTDDFYHLNYGWGESNSTCWYLLPSGMPHGYENGIIGGAVMEIEGGEIPINVSGNVLVTGQSPVGTHITLEGEKFYECYITEVNGSFELPSVLEGIYTATALLDERVYYQQLENVLIDEDNNYIFFNLGHYEYLSGNVTAPIDPEGCTIRLYSEEDVAYEGTVCSNGYYTIADVLPGDYWATASLNGNYFESKPIQVTLEDQNEDFSLQEYAGNIGFGYDTTGPTGIWGLGPDYSISCAVKLTPAELSCHQDDLLAKVRFKSPIAQDEGEISVQIWQDEILLDETEVTAYEKHEWITQDLNNFIEIETDTEYYVGYHIHTQTGELAYYDNGPRVSGKGAFFRVNNWVELPTSNNDYNFCIEPVIITMDFGTVSGNVLLDGGNGNVDDVCVSSSFYSCHPDDSGDFEIDLNPGNYELTAQLIDYIPQSISGIDVQTGDELFDYDFTLVYSLFNDEDQIVSATRLIGNYPNPFNPTTEIYYQIAESAYTKISVYNIKGQQVRTLVNEIKTPGSHRINWDGLDKNNRRVNSGVYFYSLETSDHKSARKMILIK